MRKAFLFVVLAALVVSLPARAAAGQRSGEIGADVGYTDFDSDVTTESGTDFALRGGYNFTKLFEIEGQLAQSSASDSGADISMNTMMVNAVFNFHAKDTIIPYVLGGLGQANLEFDTPLGNVDDSAGAYQLAFGTRFFFGESQRAGLRVELSTLSEKTFDETSRHSGLNVGFTWKLGS